jgi:hypothetical protein
MSKIKRKVILEARTNLDRAEDIFADLSGQKQRGLTLTHYGPYLIVDDDQDRWLCHEVDYQEACDKVLADAVAGKYTDDDGDGEWYSDLCGECQALYSRIGSGLHNDDVPGLEKLLLQDLAEEQVQEIFGELGIEIEEEVDAE